jgi:sugar O-acyltransferase (sialic acid O-acetyltransferase NeuD family)
MHVRFLACVVRSFIVTMKDIVIVGGGNIDVIQLLEDINTDSTAWKIAGILDDRLPPGFDVLGIPVLGGLNTPMPKDMHFLQSIVSSPKLAIDIVNRLGVSLDRFPNLVHPLASIYRRRDLDETGKRGNIVFQFSSIQPRVRIGDFNYVNIGCVLGHDVGIGNGNSFGPAVVVSGRAIVGDHCYIGSSAVITNGVTVADWSFVSAGAMVARDVERGCKVMGNPARVIGKVLE